MRPALVRELPFLLNPAEDFPRAIAERVRADLELAYGRLREEGSTVGALATARRLLGVEQDLPPAQVLSAQALAFEGRWREAADLAAIVADEYPTYPAAVLLLARAREKAGMLPESYAAYRIVVEGKLRGLELAEERAAALRPRALEITRNRIADSLSRGRLELAEGHLELLELWAPDEVETFETVRAVAFAAQDGPRELAALQGLAGRLSERPDLLERRAELEIEHGDSGRGLAIFQELVESDPGNPELLEKLAVAKFRWRLGLLPEEVGAVAAEPALERDAFAVLIYWLLPEVRYARPGQARIASDILDHPNREPIARVVNLGLMSVDRTLHRFSPDRLVNRGVALSALLTSLGQSAQSPSCIGSSRIGPDSHYSTVCEAAAQCGLIPSSADCLAEAPLSGDEAVELIRRALAARGGS